MKNIFEEKTALRSMMHLRRKSIPEKERASMSDTIAELAAALPEAAGARNIHLYLSIPESAEVSTVPLVDKLDAAGKPLSVPVVRDSELFTAAYRKGDLLRSAPFGQPEPVSGMPVDETQIDIVMIPLLAFDGKGYRIGYGKGFYDRFLARLAKRGILPLRIGLAFSAQMVEEIPVDPWDEPLDGIVSENGVLRFR